MKTIVSILLLLSAFVLHGQESDSCAFDYLPIGINSDIWKLDGSSDCFYVASNCTDIDSIKIHFYDRFAESVGSTAHYNPENDTINLCLTWEIDFFSGIEEGTFLYFLEYWVKGVKDEIVKFVVVF